MTSSSGKRDGGEASQSASRLDALEKERDSLKHRLHEQEANLRLAQQLLDIAIWKIELATGRLIWCEHAHHIYGVPRDDLGADFDAYLGLVHPDDRAAILACFEAFTKSDATHFEFAHRIQRQDGAVAHMRGIAERKQRDGADWLNGVVQDVTADVEAREKLAEASRLQRIAGSTARLGGWRIDRHPARTNWSPETCAIHDEPEGASPSLDASIDYYTPEYRERLHKAFTAGFETGQPFDEIAQLVTARSKRIWVRAIGEPVLNEQGSVVALQGAFQDISDLVAARDRSEGLARRLRQTLECISEAFYLLDHDWRFSFLNSQAEALLRQSPETLMGKVLWDAYPEAVGSAFQHQFETAISTGHAVHFQDYYPPLDTGQSLLDFDRAQTRT